jgi:hypothetical protein
MKNYENYFVSFPTRNSQQGWNFMMMKKPGPEIGGQNSIQIMGQWNNGSILFLFRYLIEGTVTTKVLSN